MQKSKGFLLVATKHSKYLKSAIFLADSLKDYYSECQITLFTEWAWQREIPDGIFDQIVYDDFWHHRTKLLALSQTPYDLTCYLDVDMYCEHEDIETIFDQIQDGTDIMITRIRPYNGKISEFPGGNLEYHCGMMLYEKNERTMRFMKDWWDLYQKQMSGEWTWDTELYPEKLRPWDQWSFWWLLNKTDHVIKVDVFEDDARWNFVTGYLKNECEKPIVLRHDRLEVVG